VGGQKVGLPVELGLGDDRRVVDGHRAFEQIVAAGLVPQDVHPLRDRLVQIGVRCFSGLGIGVPVRLADPLDIGQGGPAVRVELTVARST